MRPPTSLLLLSTATAAYANKHHVLVGSFSTPDIFDLEFDTTTNVLRQSARYPAHAGHASLVFNYDKKTLYGAERDGWASYSVDAAGKVRFQSNLTVATSPCPGEGTNIHGRTSVFAQVRPPYNVFGSAQRSCGNVISTKADGSLGGVLQSINYGSNSRIFSMVADPNDNYVYSADLKGNGIWVHQVDPNSGALTPVTFTAFPEADARPRRLALHSNSKYLYVLLSRTNTVGVYEVSGPSLKYTGINYSVVPQGVDPNRYVGQDILLSADDNILYASARYVPARPGAQNPDAPQQDDIDKEDEDETDPFNWYEEESEDDEDDDSKRVVKLPKASIKPVRRAISKNPGYVTAIRLTDDIGTAAPAYGPGAPGFPIDVIFQMPTSTGGGRSNALVPAPWGNEYFALTDSEVGMVQIWKVEGLNTVLRQAQAALKLTKEKRQQAPADPYQPSSQYLGDLIQPAQSDPNQQQQQQPQQDPFQQQQTPPPQDNNQPWSPPSPALNPDGSIPGYQPAPAPSQQAPYQGPQPQYQPDPNQQWGQAPPSGYQQVSYPYNQPSYQQPPPAAVPVPAPASTPAPAPASSGWGWWSTPKADPAPAAAPVAVAPKPVVVVPTGYNQGLLTGLLGGVVGGQVNDPGLTGALLGTNGGKGLLGGGGLLGLGILKKRNVVAKQPSQQAVITGALPGIRATVVAQWTAPRDAVGSADLESTVSRAYDRRPVGRFAQRQRLARRNSEVPVGGGCCSGAVWFD